DLDNAFLRRMSTKLYFNLPTVDDLEMYLDNYLRKMFCDFESDIDYKLSTDTSKIARSLIGYTLAEVEQICQSVLSNKLCKITTDDMKTLSCINVGNEDFQKAIEAIKPVNQKVDLEKFKQWSKIYGSNIVPT
ncbi:hypothetical protein GJ496_011712, partial [Pomphorhynchus laevis]